MYNQIYSDSQSQGSGLEFKELMFENDIDTYLSVL